MGGIAIAPIIASVAGSVLSSAITGGMGGDDGPSLPAVPEAAPVPEAPVVSKAKDVEEPVVDTDAARVRAAKRRKGAEDRRLFALGEEDDETVVLTKSLLGD